MHRAGRCRRICADLKFSLKQGCNPVMICKDHDHVGCLDSKLQAETSAPDFNKQRSSPSAIGIPLSDKSLTVSAADSKRAFDNVRDYGDSVCFLKKRFGYALIRSLHDLGQHSCGMLRAHGFVAWLCSALAALRSGSKTTSGYQSNHRANHQQSF